MKKWIVITLAAVIVAASVTTAFASADTAPQSKQFADVKQTNWAYDSVKTMVDKGIIKGYPDGTFRPNQPLTYGEFLKMATIAGTSEDAGNAAGNDSSENTLNWADNYYDKALGREYFRTTQITKAQLSQDITRRDMALVISAILGDVKINNYDEIQSSITDVDFKTIYEYDITKAYATGILTGYPDETFKADNTLTRAESAAVLERLLDESKRKAVGGNANTEEEKVRTYDTNTLLDMSKLPMDEFTSTTATFTDKYEFYRDGSKWNVRINRNFDGESGSFNHELRGLIYFVKDGEIVENCQTMPRYDADGEYLGYQGSIFRYDITKVDYIISVPTKSSPDNQIIKVIVNPFKI